MLQVFGSKKNGDMLVDKCDSDLTLVGSKPEQRCRYSLTVSMQKHCYRPNSRISVKRRYNYPLQIDPHYRSRWIVDAISAAVHICLCVSSAELTTLGSTHRPLVPSAIAFRSLSRSRQGRPSADAFRVFSARQHNSIMLRALYAIARPSVRLSVCQTGVS